MPFPRHIASLTSTLESARFFRKFREVRRFFERPAESREAVAGPPAVPPTRESWPIRGKRDLFIYEIIPFIYLSPSRAQGGLKLVQKLRELRLDPERRQEGARLCHENEG